MSHNFDRRRFFGSTAGLAAGLAAPYFTTSAVAENTASGEAKNDRLRLGLIGAGGMGCGNMHVAKKWGDLVAIADVDSDKANFANRTFSAGKADIYHDYRALLERDDIDALHIATPDHWHAKQLVEALQAGMDVYCEKPLTYDIGEGKLLKRVVQETGRIVQVGTQQRSTYELFTKAIALVAEGRLGKIKKVQAAIGGSPASPEVPVAPVPHVLDWDRWLGPAPAVDYRYATQPRKDGESVRVLTNGHFEFRWWYDYSGGKLTDWGAHHVDIALWALRVNGLPTAPVSVEPRHVKHPVPFKDGYPTIEDRYNTAQEFLLGVDFGNDVELIIRHDTDNGVLIEGDRGRIFVNRGKLVGKPVEDLAKNPLPEDAIQKVYKNLPVEFNEREAHWANFFHCCRTREEPISDVASHMEALNVCHLAGIACRFERKINWDSQQGQIVGDDQANALVARTYRSGYEIEM